jgi:multiple sugar transport system substrate-binding protein
MKDKKLTRRDFLTLTAGAALGSWLTACGAAPPVAQQPAAGTAGEAAQGAAPAPEQVTISFSGWGQAEEEEGIRDALKVFEEQNPDIKMEFVHIPDPGAYNDKVLSMVAAGTPPDTGFVQFDIFRTFVRDKLLFDITDLLKADPVIGKPDYFIEPQETERCTEDGRWYGIGSCWVAPHIYYNADVFEQEGIEPPSNDPEQAWDWDHFLQVATQLTVDGTGKHPGESGFDINDVQRWGVHWPTWWVPLHSAIASNGGDWIDRETGLLVIDKPEAVEAIQNIADLMLKHQVMPFSADSSGMGFTASEQLLESGTLSMIVGGSWALAWIHKINAKLGTAVLPKMKQPATNMQAHLDGMFAGTKNPEMAWKWMAFLATEFYQLKFLKIGLWLPSQTALMTPEGMEKWSNVRQSATEGVHPEGYDLIVTQYVPKYGHVLYMPPGWGKADAIINPALQKVWVGDQTAEEAMAEVVPEANAILEAEMQKS